MKRILSILLAAALVLAIAPFSASAKGVLTVEGLSDYCTVDADQTATVGDYVEVCFNAPADLEIVDIRWGLIYDKDKLELTGLGTCAPQDMEISHSNAKPYDVVGYAYDIEPYSVKYEEDMFVFAFSVLSSGYSSVELQILDLYIKDGAGKKAVFSDGQLADDSVRYVNSLNVTIDEPVAGTVPSFRVSDDSLDCDFYIGIGLLSYHGTGLEFLDHSKGEPKNSPLEDLALYMCVEDAEEFQPGVTYTARIFLTTANISNTYFSPGFTVSVNGERAAVNVDISDGKQTLIWVDYTFTVAENYSCRLGDADNDDDVTVMDATAIQRHIAELPTKSFSTIQADADEDGDITVMDATAIQRYLADLPTNPNIGKLFAVG